MSKTIDKTSYIRSSAEIERITKVKKRLFLEDKSNDGTSELEPSTTICQNDIIIFPLEMPNNIALLSNKTVSARAGFVPIVITKNEESSTWVAEKKEADKINYPTNPVGITSNQKYNYNDSDQEILLMDDLSSERDGIQNNSINNKHIISPTRKRQRQPENWNKNVLKKNRESGEEYINLKGKLRPEKKVKSGCDKNCHYKCTTHFSREQREEIKNSFYKLTDAQKNKYYKEYTEQKQKSRKRTNKEQSRRKYTFNYYFLTPNSPKQRVCKKFFCTTLDISVNRIYYFHNKIQKKSLHLVPTPARGKHIKKQTPADKIEEIINHIQSFPTQDSHFCRENSKRKYLHSGLSIAKMYALYVEKHKDPAKENIYRKVFNEKFNLGFHRPKKDACDTCSEFKANKNPNEIVKQKHEEHISRKTKGNEERAKDRDPNINENTAVVTFDLENIFCLPKAPVSCFFYSSKLTVYNLTGHCNINKSVTNAMWDETTNGRSGDDLASALIKILKKVVKHLPPNIIKLTLWSDSCVPQNRNSHMSMAIIKFLASDDSKNIIEITQKFSEPGHGNVQEVDAVHSLIERNLRHQEIYSPLGLLRALLKIKSKTLTLTFMQMLDTDFYTYHEEAIKFGFNQIPYTKVKSLTYTKSDWKMIHYKTSFDGPIFVVNITVNKIKILSEVIVKHSNSTLSEKKIKDIRSVYKYMPAEDKAYMECLIRKALNRKGNDSTNLQNTSMESKKNKNKIVKKDKMKKGKENIAK